MKILAISGLCVSLLLITGCDSSEGNGEEPFTFSSDVEAVVGGFGTGSSTNTGTTVPVMAGDDAFAPLRPLLGTVNFQYEFPSNPSGTMFTDTVVFSTEDFVMAENGVPGLAALDVDGGNTACVPIDLAIFPYLCVSEDTFSTAEDSLDYFLFSSLTNGFASGNYEFCSGDGTECDTGELTAMELIETPDGTVNVTVTNALASTANAGNEPVTARFREANEYEYKRYYESIIPAVGTGQVSESELPPEARNALSTVTDMLQSLDN